MDGWMSARGLTILGFGSSRAAQLSLRGRREKTNTEEEEGEEGDFGNSTIVKNWFRSFTITQGGFARLPIINLT
jgi:hypothetical protein